MINCERRGGLLLPFFLLLYYFCPAVWATEQPTDLLRKVQELDLASDPTWMALLHNARGKCFISDPAYYLSKDQCSPLAEINSLVQALYANDPAVRLDVACRFPARIMFLRDRLKPYGLQPPVTPCSDFDDYAIRAPADLISLVFAAENITHPMSMMGHVFLKFEGKSRSGAPIEHAASFFTRISSINLPAVALDGLLLGMPAFFALVPYSEQIAGYQKKEGRNIFEYPLIANDLEKRLIHAHVWELRTIKSPYLFLGYNCATVVYFLMALANPKLLDDLGLWISPVDVVRKSKDSGVISTRNFIPSTDWQVRFFGEQIGRESATALIAGLQEHRLDRVLSMTNPDSYPLQHAFVTALLEREINNPRFLGDAGEELAREFHGKGASTVSTKLEVENLKDPSIGPKSSHVSFGAVHFNGVPYAKIEFLPASHTLSDDNSRLYAESSLQLGSVSLMANPDENRNIILEKLSIYEMESLVPYTPFIGGTASRFIVGAQQEWDGALSPYTAAHATMGLGKALQASEDLTVYGMVNMTGSYGDGRWMLSYFPEVGATLYEVLSMKTVTGYRLICGQHGSSGCYQSANVTQSLLLSNEFAPYFSFNNLWNGDRSSQVFEFGLRIYF